MLARLTSAKRYGAVYVSRVTHGLGKSRWVYAGRRDLEHPDIIHHQPIAIGHRDFEFAAFSGVLCADTMV